MDMKKHLGDILVEMGYINIQDLNYALQEQINRLVGNIQEHYNDLFAILQIARSKYNRRGDHLLGKILLDLGLITEETIKKALRLQAEEDTPIGGDKLHKLKAIVTRINKSYNLIDIINQILVYATEIVEAESSSFILYDKNNDKLVILVPTGPQADKIREMELPTDRGIVGWVYTNNKSLIINDVTKDDRFYQEIDKLSGYKTRNILCVPISVKGEKIGAIEVINKVNNSNFTDTDLSMLEIFAAECGIAIDNTRLYYELSQQRKRNRFPTGRAKELDTKIEILKQISKTFLKDLKNSFIPVTGYIELIRKNSDNPTVRKYGSFIKRELESIIKKTDSIVQFTRGNWGIAKRRIQMKEIIEQLKNKVWSMCRLANINLSYDFSPNLNLTADPDKLIIVLVHLFTNSKNAMPRGGIFKIEAKNIKNEDIVEILVSDTGQGIKEDIRDKIFNPLFTTNKKHGAGMGLAISRAIIEAHGGTLTLLSPGNGENEGATFKISLPNK